MPVNLKSVFFVSRSILLYLLCIVPAHHGFSQQWICDWTEGNLPVFSKFNAVPDVRQDGYIGVNFTARATFGLKYASAYFEKNSRGPVVRIGIRIYSQKTGLPVTMNPEVAAFGKKYSAAGDTIFQELRYTEDGNILISFPYWWMQLEEGSHDLSAHITLYDGGCRSVLRDTEKLSFTIRKPPEAFYRVKVHHIELKKAAWDYSLLSASGEDADIEVELAGGGSASFSEFGEKNTNVFPASGHAVNLPVIRICRGDKIPVNIYDDDPGLLGGAHDFAGGFVLDPDDLMLVNPGGKQHSSEWIISARFSMEKAYLPDVLRVETNFVSQRHEGVDGWKLTSLLDAPGYRGTPRAIRTWMVWKDAAGNPVEIKLADVLAGELSQKYYQHESISDTSRIEVFIPFFALKAACNCNNPQVPATVHLLTEAEWNRQIFHRTEKVVTFPELPDGGYSAGISGMEIVDTLVSGEPVIGLHYKVSPDKYLVEHLLTATSGNLRYEKSVTINNVPASPQFWLNSGRSRDNSGKPTRELEVRQYYRWLALSGDSTAEINVKVVCVWENEGQVLDTVFTKEMKSTLISPQLPCIGITVLSCKSSVKVQMPVAYASVNGFFTGQTSPENLKKPSSSFPIQKELITTYYTGRSIQFGVEGRDENGNIQKVFQKVISPDEYLASGGGKIKIKDDYGTCVLRFRPAEMREWRLARQ